MMRSALLAGVAALAVVSADGQFKSRPDLAPPRLNITIAKETEKGLLFVAPFSGFEDIKNHGPAQPGNYIYRDNGDLVWSGYTYFSIWSANFQAARWNGQDVLFSFEGDHNGAHGHGHGHHTFLNQRYETIRELRAGNHKISDKHEFHIINEKTALLQVYQPVPRNLSSWTKNPKQKWIVDAIFQELDIETGEVLFEWNSLDHSLPDESQLAISSGHAGKGFNSSDAWDYFHINSVDKNANGDYLVSARHASTILKIDGKTGKVIWRLGGKLSNFTLGKDVEFGFQHHARFLSEAKDELVISLFDNSVYGSEDDASRQVWIYPYSRAKIIKLNTKTWKASIVKQFRPPHNISTKSQGSYQILPNGNAFVNWGSEGQITEFASNGKVVFHAYLDSGILGLGIHNYRGFRFNWTGYPTESPAIVSLVKDGKTRIYVSWNGDTETAVWRFYGSEHGKQIHLGEIAKQGFETAFKVNSANVYQVWAEAVSSDGAVLTKTRPVTSQAELSEPTIKDFDLESLDQKVLSEL